MASFFTDRRLQSPLFLFIYPCGLWTVVCGRYKVGNHRLAQRQSAIITRHLAMHQDMETCPLQSFLHLPKEQSVLKNASTQGDLARASPAPNRLTEADSDPGQRTVEFAGNR